MKRRKSGSKEALPALIERPDFQLLLRQVGVSDASIQKMVDLAGGDQERQDFILLHELLHAAIQHRNQPTVEPTPLFIPKELLDAMFSVTSDPLADITEAAINKAKESSRLAVKK